MENITHSLIGVAFAELALPIGATPSMRRLFMYTGIIASNLPDADLVYTRIMPPPLGYLLHHRGHTHTIVGALALAALVALVVALPGLRRVAAPARGRLWGLIVVSLLAHLVLDSWNSYGIHPFYPIDNAWYYGDAVSIVEPWLWVMLGVAAATNATRRWARFALATGLAALPLVLHAVGWLSVTMVIAVFAGAVVAVSVAARKPPWWRSGAALVGTAVFVACMFGASWVARREILAALPAAPGVRVVDVVLSPAAAVPLSWTFIVIEKDATAGDYVLRRGVFSFGRRLLRAPFAEAPLSPGAPIATRLGRVTPWQEVRQPLGRLRELSREDCRVRAWLQFGRVPAVGDTEIGDLRFGNTARANFTTMRLSSPAAASTCPPNMTRWDMPRADLLSP